MLKLIQVLILIYKGMSVSDLRYFIPGNYNIRIVRNVSKETIKLGGSNTLNIIVDKNNIITKVLGYYDPEE